MKAAIFVKNDGDQTNCIFLRILCFLPDKYTINIPECGKSNTMFIHFF